MDGNAIATFVAWAFPPIFCSKIASGRTFKASRSSFMRPFYKKSMGQFKRVSILFALWVSVWHGANVWFPLP